MARAYEKEGGMRTYLTIAYNKGKLVERVEEGTPGAVPYTGKDKEGNPTQKWRKEYFATSFGRVTKLEHEKSEFGTKLVIHLEHEEGVDVLQINRDNTYGFDAYYRDIATKLGNIDWSREVSFSPNGKKYRLNRDGSPKTNKHGDKVLIQSLWVNYAPDTGQRFGDTVPLKYKFAKRGVEPTSVNVPMMEKIMVRGEEKWDSTKQDNFLYDAVMEAIESFKSYQEGEKPAEDNPTPQKEIKGETTFHTSTSASDGDGKSFVDDDDLPF